MQAFFGPAELKDLSLGITWNPDHEENTTVKGHAALALPAGAGIRLSISAAIGAGIPVVEARLGLEIGGLLGIEAAVGAAVDIDWTPAKGLVLDAVAEAYAEPVFKFDITGFARIDLDLWLKTINLYEKKWALAAFAYGSGLRLGVKLPVHYEEGKPFEPSFQTSPSRCPTSIPRPCCRAWSSASPEPAHTGGTMPNATGPHAVAQRHRTSEAHLPDATRRLRRAAVLHLDGDLDAAEAEYVALLADEPGHTAALKTSASCAASAATPTAPSRRTTPSVGTRPLADRPVNKANAYLALSQPARAMPLLQRAVTLDPDSPAWVALGQASLIAGDLARPSPLSARPTSDCLSGVDACAPTRRASRRAATCAQLRRPVHGRGRRRRRRLVVAAVGAVLLSLRDLGSAAHATRTAITLEPDDVPTFGRRRGARGAPTARRGRRTAGPRLVPRPRRRSCWWTGPSSTWPRRARRGARAVGRGVVTDHSVALYLAYARSRPTASPRLGSIWRTWRRSTNRSPRRPAAAILQLGTRTRVELIAVT